MVSQLYCKVHVEFHRRHGSYWHRSYLAWELTPYRTSARRWIRAHRKDSLVVAVIATLDGMLSGSGIPESAYDLRWMPPAEKARVALARMHRAGVPGVRLLEITLAVSARVAEHGPYDQEFLEVQIAKLVHRLASGTHRTSSGLPLPSKYPPSAGRLLRILGHRIWDTAAVAANHEAVEAVAAMARPDVAAAESRQAHRKERQDKLTREIERVRRLGMGPQRLAQYRRELRRQYKL